MFITSNSGRPKPPKSLDSRSTPRTTDNTAPDPVSISPTTSKPSPWLGQVLISSNLDVEGHLTAKEYLSYSDMNLKEHIEDLQEASQVLMELRGYTFRWRQMDDDGVVVNEDNGVAKLPNSLKRFTGFLAQEVLQRVPEAVTETANGWLAVEYQAIIPFFVSAVNEHVVRLERLQKQTEELESLRTSLSSLSHSLVALRNTPTPSPPPSPPLTPTLTPKLRVSKPQRFRDLLWKYRLYSAVGASVLILLIAAISLGVALVMSTSSSHISPPTLGPTTFSPNNYLVDGGFENPSDSVWSGSAKITSYSESLAPPGSYMQSTAPFSPMSRFLRLDTDLSESEFSQTIQRTTSFDFLKLSLSVWVFISSSAGSSNTISSQVYVTRQTSSENVLICSATSSADMSFVMRWQQLSTTLTCIARKNDSLVVRIQAFGSGLLAAVDAAELLESQAPVSVDSIFERSEVTADFPREPDGIVASTVILAPSNRFILGCFDPSGYADEADIVIVRLEPEGLRDFSYGEGNGAARIPLLKQTTSTVQSSWVASDPLGRVYVGGKMKVGDSFWVPAVARLLENGTLDLSFGRSNTGIVPLFFEGPDGLISGTAISVFVFPNGSSFAVSRLEGINTSGRIGATRLDSSGRLDQTYNTGFGYTVAEYSQDSFLAYAANDPSRITTLASLGNAFILTQTLPDGNADPSFGASGVEIPFGTDFSLTKPTVSKVLHLSDGGLLICGGRTLSTTVDPFCVKLNASGAADPSWDTFFNFPGDPSQDDQIVDVFVRSDDTILIGTASATTFHARAFSISGRANTSFCGTGELTLNATQLGALTKFAVSDLDAMTLTSFRSMSGISSHANVITVSVTFSASPGFSVQVLTDQPPYTFSGRFQSSSLLFDSMNNRLYTTSTVIAAPRGPWRTVSISAVDLRTGHSADFGIAPPYGYILQDSTSDLASSHIAGSLLQLSDGRLITTLSLYSPSEGITGQVGLVRRFSTGYLDRSFGSLGTATIYYGAMFAPREPKAALLPGDGILVVAPAVNGSLWIGCYTSDGDANPMCNLTVDGSAFFPGNSSISVETVEHLIVNASRTVMIAVTIRINNALRGGLWTFELSTSPTNIVDRGLSVLRLPAAYNESALLSLLTVPNFPGYTFVGGSLSSGDKRDIFVARLLPNGALDTSYGQGGFFIAPDRISASGYARKLLWDAQLQSIVVVGSVTQRHATPRLAVFVLRADVALPRCTSGRWVYFWRKYPAAEGVNDVIQVGNFYLVSLKSTRTVMTVGFSSSDLPNCAATCGDGIIDAGEQCDDGNTESGDGCSASCGIEAGYICPYEGRFCEFV